MRLLLTSNGITNPSIEKALKKWVKDIKIAFIPTAANMVEGDKYWLIRNYVECQKLGPVYIADISAVDKKIWLPRLKKANVIVIGGGNSVYLMEQIRSSGLEKELPRLLKNRIYVGISAGSLIVSSRLYASSRFLFGNRTTKIPKGLGYVDFNIRTHLNSPKFPKFKDENLKKLTRRIHGDLYAIDNQSALVYDNGKVSVVSEGGWKLYKR